MEDSLFIRIIASPKRGATDIYLIDFGTSNVGLIELVQTISSKAESLICYQGLYLNKHRVNNNRKHQ
jgi:hypothetical protein